MYLMEGQFNIWWPNLERQKVWQMLTKAKIVHRLAWLLRIFRIYRNAMRIFPENQDAIFQKKLAFQEHQFWGSSMMSSFLTKFKITKALSFHKLFPYKIQIFQRQTDQNKAERETFFEDISQRIENYPGLLHLNDLNNVDHCCLCGASAALPVSQYFATKRWIVLISGTLFLPKSLLHCRCVRRTDFRVNYASMIFISCGIVNCPVGSILVSKESPRSAV